MSPLILHMWQLQCVVLMEKNHFMYWLVTPFAVISKLNLSQKLTIICTINGAMIVQEINVQNAAVLPKRNSCRQLASWQLSLIRLWLTIMFFIFNLFTALHEFLMPGKHMRPWQCLILELCCQFVYYFGQVYTITSKKLYNNTLLNRQVYLFLDIVWRIT